MASTLGCQVDATNKILTAQMVPIMGQGSVSWESGTVHEIRKHPHHSPDKGALVAALSTLHHASELVAFYFLALLPSARRQCSVQLLFCHGPLDLDFPALRTVGKKPLFFLINSIY